MPIPRTPPARTAPGARRATILELLRATSGPVEVPDVAAATGLHPNTARAHLTALVRAGTVVRTSRPAGRRGRPRDVYTAVPPEPDGHELLATVLADRLVAVAPDVTDAALEAGRAWADRLAAPTPSSAATPRAALLGALDHLGFRPEPAGREIRLHACPFRGVARGRPEVVCTAHLGLIRRTLESAGAGDTRADLDPLVTPSLCIVRLTGAGASEPDPPRGPAPVAPVAQ